MHDYFSRSTVSESVSRVVELKWTETTLDNATLGFLADAIYPEKRTELHFSLSDRM